MRVLILLLLLVSPAYSALDFDGAAANNNSINIGTADIIQENRALTFYWRGVADTVGTSNAGRWFSRGAVGSTNNYELQFNSASTDIDFRIDGATDLVRNSGTGFITLGADTVLIVTWDGSTTAANVHMYVNGVEEDVYGTTTNGVSLVDSSGQTTYFGNRPSDNGREFNGLWREMAMWSRVLSASEIAMLSNPIKYTPLTIPTSLEVYWTFDDGTDAVSASSAVIRDRSTAGINGTGSVAGITWSSDNIMNLMSGMVQ